MFLSIIITAIFATILFGIEKQINLKGKYAILTNSFSISLVGLIDAITFLVCCFIIVFIEVLISDIIPHIISYPIGYSLSAYICYIIVPKKN